MKYRELFTVNRVATIGTIIVFTALWTDLPFLPGFLITMCGLACIAWSLNWNDKIPRLLNMDALRLPHILAALVAYSIVSSVHSNWVMQRTESLVVVAVEHCMYEGVQGNAIEVGRCIMGKLPEARDAIAQAKADARDSDY